MRILVNNSQNSQMFRVGRHEAVLFPFSGNKTPGNNYLVAIIDNTSGDHVKSIDRLISAKRLRVVEPAAICGLSALNVARADNDGITPLSNTTPIQAGIISESLLRREYAGLFTDASKTETPKPATKNETETIVVKSSRADDGAENPDTKSGSGEVVFNTGGDKAGRATPLRR
jgi:hypothetical protein